MPQFESRIDDHIAKAGDFARPILEHFRAAVHRIVPECEEAIKWGMPHFTLAGRNMAGMAAFKKHVSIFFHHDEQAGGTGKFRQIKSVEDLPPVDELEGKIRAAVERLAKPAASPEKAAPKPVPTMPQPFAEALAGSGLVERFEAMPAGYRREYIEWVAEAKTDATRDKRIAQSVEWIGEGKHRNWKYQKC
ncbi:YdeI/OmpD-associated family protein [Novosphingobium sp. MMS21-SN21R]|uniref:YdeI/OmpD-associated family protein n=1 Tax=Novosphingobium sp. MMS21-SN21R TaxID=2969298 RepID=UPI002888DDC5|nr:YdeI/OmpD-associated family protein [Novosphingobium sp. MMS21-SN21R]MDT0508039.1 YdeI/OmpD-associated family protein [Novosphingobium sp. MMS21-SN21R]